MEDWEFVPIDGGVLAVYMRELQYQQEAAALAVQSFNAALASRERGGVPQAFAAVQGILASGALVSKMLWPQPPKLTDSGQPLTTAQGAQRKNTKARGAALRKALAIKSMPILESRKVRNAFEHFDDRLDRYFEEGNRIVVDRNVGPQNNVVVIGDRPALHLRLIDNVQLSVSVLDDKLSIQELFNAIDDVGMRAARWVKTHDR